MGGTDDLSNIEHLTIKQHSNAHKVLYEKYGHWQDKVAWMGLAGIIPHEECIRLAIVEGSKKGAKISNEKQGIKGQRKKHKKHKKIRSDSKMWGNQHTAGTYKIICPDYKIIEVVGLSKWCRDNNLNFKAFHKAVVQRKSSHKGYKLGPEL